MGKIKTIYVCRNCGATFVKWQGKCTMCNEWSSLVEEIDSSSTGQGGNSLRGLSSTAEAPQAVRLQDISSEEITRIPTGNKEFDRVLGGGLVPGAVTLIGGEPGIGKSTLALEIALRQSKKVLYVSGEESLKQIKMRATRLQMVTPPNCFFLSDTSIDRIKVHMEKICPDLVIVDSIQTIYSEGLDSSAGSVSQIRYTAQLFIDYAKQHDTPMFIIGHINKEGNLAGPKVLEHMVDTVLQFEGETHYAFRIVRAMKNRFGSISELSIFEMTSQGLKPVENPSHVLLSSHSEPVSGVAVGVAIEGARPLAIEVQALVSQTNYPAPQRSSTGIDPRRLNMLVAVIEKKLNLRLNNQDLFVNITGGLRIDDPALDLTIISAIVSSFLDKPLDSKSCFIGEIGLSGELRPISRPSQRFTEAIRLGFERLFVPVTEDFSPLSQGELVFTKRVEEVLRTVFKKGGRPQ